VISTPALVVKLLRELDALNIPYAVGGSFASSAWGRPRQTRDLDVGVLISAQQAQRLADAVEGEFVLSRQEMEQAASGDGEFRSFQLLHMEEVFKIDVFAFDISGYTTDLMSRRRPYPLAPSYDAQFLSPEDIVITKLRWYVLGNRVSDRQWNDIVQVLEMQEETFDFEYAARWCEHFGVGDDLELAKTQVLPP
jgi:hypothetical protein